jgi:predicted nucleic acid-binding protein
MILCDTNILIEFLSIKCFRESESKAFGTKSYAF